MHGNRPWDFEQEFEVASNGETAPAGGKFGKTHNKAERKYADAVERQEVRELVSDARERHSGCHECANWDERTFVPLNDVPWGYLEEDLIPSPPRDEDMFYPQVRQS